MHASLITVTGFCALAMAAPEQAKRQYPSESLASVQSQISSLYAELAPPSSIASELTGVPTASLYSVLANPTALSSFEAAFVSAPPAWFTSLPADAQSYIFSVAPKYVSIESEIIALEVSAGLTTLPGAVGTAATVSSKPTGSSNGTVTSTKGATITTGATMAPTTTGSGSGSSSKGSSSSSSAGAAPTGVVAAGVMGAVGFLGLALAL